MENGSQDVGCRLARLCFIDYPLRLQPPKKNFLKGFFMQLHPDGGWRQ